MMGNDKSENVDVISDAPDHISDTGTVAAANTESTHTATITTITGTNVEENSERTRSGAKCLTFEKSFDDLVASSSSIFLTMPAKVAGFSLQAFAKQCVGGDGGGSNPLNEIEKRKKVFHAKIRPAKIISSHVRSDTTMIELFQNVPRDTLIVYFHRNENDRLLSAIRQVILSGACKKNITFGVNVEKDGSRCVFDEKDAINHLIKPKPNEISMGNSEIMTCEFYRAMEDTFPRMVFVHYTKADDVQNVLAKHNCPKLVGQPIRINTEEDKRYLQAYLRLEDGKEIELNEWMEAKRDLLEFTFQMKTVDRGATTCQAKTRGLEDDLSVCEDEIFEITRDTSF